MVEILTIRSLGGLTIALGEAGPPLHFETRTVEALLVYLAAQGRAVGRDPLAELLWPERSQEQARTNLSLALHRLRRQLEPYLLVTRQTLALNPSVTVFDADHFESYLATGKLVEATALYHGAFLDGFYVRNNPAFEHWALLERDRLHTLALAAWQQRTSQMAAAGQLDDAIAGAQRLLQLDPLHEPTHRQLMRLLAQNGQRAAALTQYENCRQLLAAELDVTPDEATIALYEQMRVGAAGEPVEKKMAAPWTLAAAPAQPHNLPYQPTPLIGRGAEVAQIETLLANPDCRLLTLLGIGGIGKSRLAVEAAARQSAHYAGGVCFVPLAAVAQAAFVPSAIAQSLGLQNAGGDLLAEIAAYLRPRTMLLLLDNFEHLLEAVGVVTYLLQHAPGVKALVTSRQRLALREEWLLPVTGLAVADGPASEGGQLFVRTAQRVHPAFTGEDAAIAAICRLVEGMPLALELAASWARVMSCAEIARQIEGNFDFLSSQLHNLPQRHRSLRALFDQSWRLLSPLEQGVLMRLSLFAGGCTLEEAAPVSGATLPLLLALVERSLVRAAGHDRFDLHELVRQYAAEKLAAGGAVETAQRRHYETYLHLFRTGDPHLRRAEVAVWYARLEAEQDNLRAALQWALDGARYEEAAWLMVAVHYFWYLGGQRFEGGQWLARLLPYRQSLAADLRLALLICYFASAQEVAGSEPLDRYRGEFMQLLEGCSTKGLASSGWYFLAWSAANQTQALAALEQATALAREADQAPPLADELGAKFGPEFGPMAESNFNLAGALQTFAESLIEQGEASRGAAYAQESLERFRRQGDRYGIAASLGTLGRLAFLQGNLERARTLLLEVRGLITPFSSRVIQTRWQPLLGLVTLYSGDIDEARRLLDESLRHCLDFKNKRSLGLVCAYLAELALWEGEAAQAGQWLAQSLAYDADAQSTTMLQVQRLLLGARLAAAQARTLDAAKLFGVAEAIRSRIGYALVEPVRSRVNEAWVGVAAELGAEAAGAAWAAGQCLAMEEAFALIDDGLPDRLAATA